MSRRCIGVDLIGSSGEEWNVEYEFHKDLRGEALYCGETLLGK